MARLAGVRRLFRLPRAERDVAAAVDDELAFHLQMSIEQLIASGRTPEEAHREAMRRFGDVDRVRRSCYDISTEHEASMRRTELWTTLWQDLKSAARARLLDRHPRHPGARHRRNDRDVQRRARRAAAPPAVPRCGPGGAHVA